MRRLLWMLCGAIALGLGVLGALLPLLPATPFLLLAAFAFARSSPALHGRLLRHPVFGRAIRDWNEKRAISHKGKFASIAAMAASLGASVLLEASTSILAMQTALLAGVAAFILTRNSV